MKEQVNRTIKINAGIACLDRANEVEPRPNEGTECRDGARTVSSSARKRINDVFDYVRGDGARTVSTTAK
ncbi:MAG: hypothetical protein LBG80_03795 [Bacteroidales bacterium]|jgi:hypothetical protein|nr:hypothetical protein [Bacteroidales bacterium]